MALAEPMPKSQLFWMGTLIRLATGFWSFLASSASLACSSSPAPPPLEELASAGARVTGWWKPKWSRACIMGAARAPAKAKRMSFVFILVFTGYWLLFALPRLADGIQIFQAGGAADGREDFSPGVRLSEIGGATG